MLSTRNRSPRLLWLCMLKGSFLTADDGAAPAMTAKMGARVWRKLPEELIWEVLRFVPAVMHFRWQLVSHKWRQVLTSANFRARWIAAAAERQQQPCVVGAVAQYRWPGHCREVKAKLKVVDKDLKVVEIHLCWFVPRSFRKYRIRSYTVVAAANGLVCISNANRYRAFTKDQDRSSDEDDSNDDEETQYCVLNPLTRTCKVLPPLPFIPKGWLPPTPTAVTMFGYMSDQTRRDDKLALHPATYDLAANGGTGGRWDLAATRTNPRDVRFFSGYSVVTVCAGKTYVSNGRWVSVLVPGGPDGTLLEAACVNEPSVVLLFGMEDDPSWAQDSLERHLVAHRGDVFLLKAPRNVKKVVTGVWRLAHERVPLEWELVAQLDVAELERLTGVKPIMRDARQCDAISGETLGVRDSELLYFSVAVYHDAEALTYSLVVLGLNLNTRNWELVHGDAPHGMKLVELRPDLFLS